MKFQAFFSLFYFCVVSDRMFAMNYETLDFYHYLQRFMSEDFACVRKAYLFNLLGYNENLKLLEYLQSIFPATFLRLISLLHKKHRADQISLLLMKFLKYLEDKFYKIECIITMHAQLSVDTLAAIEIAVKDKFKVDNIVFKYVIDPALLYGISLELDYKIYHMNIRHVLDKAHANFVDKLKKGLTDE